MYRLTYYSTDKNRFIINANHHPLEVYEEPGERVHNGKVPLPDYVFVSPPTTYLAGEAVDRLAAYENTGMEPGEIENLKNGHCAGCYIPTCKIGDEVWAIRNFKGVKHAKRGRVSEMFYTNDMRLMIVVRYISRGEWGKTVFPTQAAAESALREEKSNEADL